MAVGAAAQLEKMRRLVTDGGIDLGVGAGGLVVRHRRREPEQSPEATVDGLGHELAKPGVAGLDLAAATKVGATNDLSIRRGAPGGSRGPGRADGTSRRAGSRP